MKNSRLIIVGGGSLGREIINWVADLFESGDLPKLSGFIDDTGDTLRPYEYGLQYLGRIDSYAPRDGDKLILCISDPLSKRKIVSELKNKGASFLTIIHPSAVIARSAKIGEGVVVCPNSFISADARVGNFVTVNGLSSVGHDVKIGDFTTLSAHVDLTGWVSVGEECFFGTSAKVLPKVIIGAGSRMGAGTVIVRNVKERTVMYSLPSKRLK